MTMSRIKSQCIVGLSSLFFITATQAGSPVLDFQLNENPVIHLDATGTATVTYTITNKSKSPHSLALSSTTPTGIVSAGGLCRVEGKSPANPNPTCTLILTINGSALPANHLSWAPTLCEANPNGTPNANQCFEPCHDKLDITRITAPDITTLSTSIPSPSILALSVNAPSINPALTGNPRLITISNTGTKEATGLTISYPIWPGGTTAASTCGSSLAAGASCTITITPGSEATSSCNTGIAPTPGTITMSANNVATTVTSNIVVLNYGCQYQGGFLYSVDDTTNNGVTGTCLSPPCTKSIGGIVASLVDQAAPSISSGSQLTSIIWSVDNVTILGIDDTSTTSNPSPVSPPYSPGTPAYTPCNGASDGACNSGNILSYYNYNNVSADDYAAGLCTASINSYSDWYLPSICEMVSVGGLVLCPEDAQNMATNLAFLIGNWADPMPSISCPPPVDTDCLAGEYWSSTENTFGALNPRLEASAAYFESNFNSSQYYGYKGNPMGTRCSRALTH